MLKRLMWVWTELILLVGVSLGRVRVGRRRSRREVREMWGSRSQGGSTRGLVVAWTWLDRHWLRLADILGI